MSDLRENALADLAEDDLVVLPRRHTMDDVGMDITPMIDITFLLLIFFLVAARVQSDATAELPAARYGEGVTAKTAAILTLTRGLGENAVVFLGDSTADAQRMETADLLQQEEEIAAFVERQFRGHPPGMMPKEHVLIKAARDVRSREVARIARAAARANTAREIRLYVAVREVQR